MLEIGIGVVCFLAGLAIGTHPGDAQIDAYDNGYAEGFRKALQSIETSHNSYAARN